MGNRHDRRASASVERRGVASPQGPVGPKGHPGSEGHNVFVLCASYRGAQIATIKNLFEFEHAAQDAGHAFAFDGVDRMPLDLARNETVTMALASKATAILLQDDDCQVDPLWLPQALGLLSEEYPIITAPCRLRGEKIVYNIMPCEPPVEVDGARLMKCIWTGLGCVLVRREVLQSLHDALPHLHYASVKLPGKTSCGIFQSGVVPARVLQTGDPPETRLYILDDRVFSLRVTALGLPIWASIDVDTVHEGYRGNFGVTLDAHEASKGSGGVVA